MNTDRNRHDFAAAPFFGKGLSGSRHGRAELPLDGGRRCQQTGVPPGVVNPLHHPAKAKRVIFLYQAGGPSHLETFDYKPKLRRDARQADAGVVHQGPADRAAARHGR